MRDLSVLLSSFCGVEAGVTVESPVVAAIFATVSPLLYPITQHPRVHQEMACAVHHHAKAASIPAHVTAAAQHLARRAAHASDAAWHAACESLLALLCTAAVLPATAAILPPLLVAAPAEAVCAAASAAICALLGATPLKATAYAICNVLLERGYVLAPGSPEAQLPALALHAIKKSQGTPVAVEAGLFLAAHYPDLLPRCTVCSLVMAKPIDVAHPFGNGSGWSVVSCGEGFCYCYFYYYFFSPYYFPNFFCTNCSKFKPHISRHVVKKMCEH